VLALMRRLLNKRLIPENIIIISGFHWVLTLTFEHIFKRPVWHVSAVENGQRAGRCLEIG